MTRGDVLKYAIAFALRGASKVVRGLKQGLTETERYTVADHVVCQLKERGDPWHWAMKPSAAMRRRLDRAAGATSKITIMDKRYVRRWIILL
jgi:hypothetical protein